MGLVHVGAADRHRPHGKQDVVVSNLRNWHLAKGDGVRLDVELDDGRL